MSERVLPEGILTEYIKYTNNTEIPILFAFWCCVSAISACLGRRVWIKFSHLTYYPNLFVVLVAGSARCRKSTAINMARKMITEISPAVNIFSQKMTPEAFIVALSDCGISVKQSGKIINKASEGIVIADELSTLVDKKSFESGMISFLTTLWDNHDHFEYTTLKHGKLIVPRSCISILGGSTEAWIKESVPRSAIGGGFTSRVIFVYRAKPSKFVPIPICTDENMKRYCDILTDLNAVRQLSGSFEMTKEASDFYCVEYERWFTNNLMERDSRLAGYVGRRMDMLIKLSMIVSASYSNSMKIELQDLRIAKDWLMKTEETMEKVMNAITTGEVGQMTQEVLAIIKMWGVCSRRRLLQRVSHCLTANTLEVVLETLEQAGYIEVEVDAARGGRTYRYVAQPDGFTQQVLDSRAEKLSGIEKDEQE